MSKIAFRSIDPNDRHADLVRIAGDPARAILQRVGRRLSTCFLPGNLTHV